MTTMTQMAHPELATALRDAIDGECEETIREACLAITRAGADVDIVQDDDGPEAFDGGDSEALWVVSSHYLTVAGVRVAEWTRCARGDYGDASRGQCYADTWCVREDTDGSDRLPAAVAVALDALSLDDELPDVPEPTAAVEDGDGDYAVLHKNDYAVSGGQDAWRVVSRHEDEDTARRACDACWRGFESATTAGSYGPEWCVGEMGEDGEWTPIPDDDA